MMTIKHIESCNMTPMTITRVTMGESTTWKSIGATSVCGELTNFSEYAFMRQTIPFFKADAVGIIAETNEVIYAYKLN